ncbi:MAG: LptA/OstA family protein [Planctomycetota bacterium]
MTHSTQRTKDFGFSIFSRFIGIRLHHPTCQNRKSKINPQTFTLCVLCVLCVEESALWAGEPPAAAPPAVTEGELQRKERIEKKSFPWLDTQKAPRKPSTLDSDALPDMTTGDTLMRSAGELYRVAPKVTFRSDSRAENDKNIAQFLSALDAHFQQINSTGAAPALGKPPGAAAGEQTAAGFKKYPNLPDELVGLVEDHRRLFEDQQGAGAAPARAAGVPPAAGNAGVPPAGRPAQTEDLELEMLTFTKDVEIEQAQSQVVVRGQKITVVRNAKTGLTALLVASGKVEMATPERKGRGERLVYRIPDGQLVKDEYTLRGNPETGAKATFWQGDDVIEAMDLFSDRRRDTFRVWGQPVAIIKAPEAPAAQPGGANVPAQAGSQAPNSRKPDAAAPGPAGGGLFPGFGLASGDKIRMRTEGMMFYEGPSGQVRIKPNVVIQQDAPDGSAAMIMNSDEALVTLLPPPPGEPAAQAGLFAGSLKTLECLGRVDIRMPTQTILCDRSIYDMQNNTFFMEMKNPKDEVQVYMREDEDGGKVLLVPHTLKYFMATAELQAGARHMKRFTGTPPTNRDEKPKVPNPKPAIPNKAQAPNAK